MAAAEMDDEEFVTLEICVDHITSVEVAQRGGARRIELCQALDLGGLTPSSGLVVHAKKILKIPLFMMIRPRGGDFFYNMYEADQMVTEIEMGLELGVDGFVTGALKKDKNGIIGVDKDLCKELITAARGKPVTFHRAFDVMTCALETAVEDVIELGFKRILTSGREHSAMEGMDCIREIALLANGRIIVVPDLTGCGIVETNVMDIYKLTRGLEFHASAILRKFEPEDNPPRYIVAGAYHYDSTNYHIVKTLSIMLQQARDECR